MRFSAAILLLLALIACSPAPVLSVKPWLPFQHGLPSQATVLALAVDPHDPQRILAGTYDSTGAYLSADGGRSWRAFDDGLEHLPVLTFNWSSDSLLAGTTAGLYRLVGQKWSRVDAIPNTAVYAIAGGADGALYLATDQHGIFASADSGNTWQNIPGLDGEILLSVSSLDDQTLLAGTSGHGAFITRNRGGAWESLDEFRGDFVSLIAADPRDRRSIFLRTRHGLYRSRDAAATWQLLGGGLQVDIVYALLFDSSTQMIYAATGGHGVLASDDAGASWRNAASGLPQGAAALALAQVDGPTLLAGTQVGVYITRDEGHSWSAANDGLGAPQVHALALNPQTGVVFAATETGLYRSDSGGDLRRIGGEAMAPVLSVAVAPTDPHIMVASVYRRGLFISADAGRTWNPAGDIFAGRLSPTGIAINPQNADTLFVRVLFERIYKSADRGDTWHSVWTGMPDQAEVEAMAIAPSDPTQMYAGADDGFYSSGNGGESWTPHGLEGQTVFAMWIDPHDPGVVLAGATSGLYRSADAGKTWTPLGLAQISVTAIARDLNGNLYAGTKYDGVWMSADQAKSWKPLDVGMDKVSVIALVVDDARGILYAATTDGIFRMNLGNN